MSQKQTLKSIFILLLGAILGSLITGLAIYQLKYKSSYEADYLRLPAQARQIQLNLEQLRLGNVELVIGNLESNLDSKLVEINMY